MKLDGYVIVPPVSPWDDAEKVIPLISYRSFGTTPMETWMRFCDISQRNMNTSTIIQRCHDRGYRLKKATLIIEDNNESEN